jgi:hypothetical protein
MSTGLRGKNNLKNFWSGQRAALYGAVVCGAWFWFLLSPVKGLLFALVMFLIIQPFLFFDLWKLRKLKSKTGTHQLSCRDEGAVSVGRDAAKVTVPLVINEIGYPPVDTEILWVEAESESGRYIVKSIPFYAVGISYGDIIAVSRLGGSLVFSGIVCPSSHSRPLVVVHKHGLIEKISNELKQLGCHTEHNYIKGFMSVDVPGEVHYSSVFELLSGYRDAKKIILEEPVLRHSKNQ